MKIVVGRGDFCAVAADAVVLYSEFGMPLSVEHERLLEHRGSVPLDILHQCLTRAIRPLHAVVAAEPSAHAGSFQHVVFGINHYQRDVGRELVYRYALTRASNEGFRVITIPLSYEHGGVSPKFVAEAMRVALFGQDSVFGNQITTVNLVARDAQSHAALRSVFPREYL